MTSVVFIVLVERTEFSDGVAYVQSVYSNETDARDALARWLRKHSDGIGRVEGPLKVMS